MYTVHTLYGIVLLISMIMLDYMNNLTQYTDIVIRWHSTVFQ